MSVTKQLLDPIDFHTTVFPTIEVNGVHQPFVNRHSSRHLLLCSAEEKYTFETT